MKKNKVINFGFLFVAFVFFCNPNINIIDLLPDCIGCLLIAWGIGRIGDLCEDLDEAKRAFFTLFWINLSKGPALILLMWIVGKNMQEGTMWLLFAFCYAVAEAVFGIRAFKQLFDGLSYLGQRNDGGDFIFGMTSKKGKARCYESVMRFTAFFIVLKAAACTLPEFVYIYPQDYINNSGFEALRFRPLLIVFGFIVALVFGIIWLVKICKYTAHLSRFKDFWEDMHSQYVEKVLPRKGLFVMRYTKVFAYLVTAALFLTVNVYIDEYNLVPDFLAAILFFASACVIGKYSGGAKALKVTSVIYFVTSVASFMAMIVFKTDGFSEFGYIYRNVHAIERAAQLYNIYALITAVMQVALIAVMFSLAAVMMRIVRAHTGINTITGVSNSSRPLEKVYGARINRVRAMSVIASIMSVLYFYLIIYYERVELRNGSYSYMPRFEIVWLVDFFVTMVFAIHASNVVNDLNGEVNYKYKYD